MQDNSIAIKATAICKMLTCHYYMYVRRKFYRTKEAQVYIIMARRAIPIIAFHGV